MVNVECMMIFFYLVMDRRELFMWIWVLDYDEVGYSIEVIVDVVVFFFIFYYKLFI